MHPLVAGLYGRVAAVKVLSFLDSQGYPFALPLMSLQPAAPDVLVFSRRQMRPYLSQLQEGALVASSIITMEPIAFQVKGRYRSVSSIWGALILDQAYHASPPYVGKRIA